MPPLGSSGSITLESSSSTAAKWPAAQRRPARVALAQRVQRGAARAPVVVHEVFVEAEVRAVERGGARRLDLGDLGVVVRVVVEDAQRGAHARPQANAWAITAACARVIGLDHGVVADAAADRSGTSLPLVVQ